MTEPEHPFDVQRFLQSLQAEIGAARYGLAESQAKVTWAHERIFELQQENETLKRQLAAANPEVVEHQG